MPDPELLKSYMMRGALRGAASTDEPANMTRCNGKLENGARCHLVASPGEELCTACDKRGAETYVAPLRAHSLKENPKMNKHIYCAAKGCYRIVKKKGDFCKVHQGLGDQVEAGVAAASESGETLPDVVAAAPWELASSSAARADLQADLSTSEVVAIGMGDDTEDLAHAPLGDQLAGADKEIFFCNQVGCFNMAPDGQEVCDTCMAGKIMAVARENTLVASAPPQEQATACAATLSGLSRLLRPVPPPPKPAGLVVPFAPDEVVALAESEISVADVRDLVLLLLDGKLMRVT